MNRLVAYCLLGLSAVATAQPMVYRPFPAAGCAFSLPDREWEWLDPAQAPSPQITVAFARNRSGLMFMLEVEPIKPGETVNLRSYRQFEEVIVRREGSRKLAGTHLSFNHVPSYQFDMERPGRGNWGRLLLAFADNRLYALNVQSSRGPAPDEAAALFDRFKFLDTPRPMLPPHDGSDDDSSDQVQSVGERLGEWITGLGSVGLVLLLIFGAWAVIRIRS